ncbi:acyltransferase family protein [Promicromonospora sukumoe]|uniref:Peptidoglycan/LPS O-acetylase OafA/YrhL n=1 Tax=Promicromonospora sukumoe TaxID=88382 RepID=A0A7W3JBW4_9MICO|nr:acyltransferase family protein [Promicromonospora sukumoe]MBA8809988.1 peptidoglycan/LPS O-acetylase OafA/YrhL [Promicromonospora sukumoe]
MTATTTAPTAPSAPPGSTAAGPTAPPRKFRPEVQALRALAVLLVIVYHVDPALLPGGYIGVDVFFVISGFLITGHLWREASTTGTVSLKKFWAARARRILPASLVATVGTLAVALVLLPLDLLQLWWRHALASVFYVENWALAADAVDYQAAGNEPTAFQHFWSLGVEEQFYLFWPILVVLALRLWSLRSGRAAGEARDTAGLRRTLLVIFGVVVAASLVWSVLEVRADNPEAYYSTLTRVWELGAGGVLALLMRDTERFRALRSTLAVGGVALIVAAACFYSDATPFPGVAALVPVLGTSAVIVAGRTSGPGSLRRIAESWVVQRIGDVSYSLYLWHFPVVVFFAVRTERTPTLPDVVALLVVSFALAIGSYVLVERPVRTLEWFRSDGRMLVSALVAMVVVAGLTFALPLRAQSVMGEWDQRAESVSADTDARVAESLANGLVPFLGDEPAMTPNPLRAAADEWPEADRCLAPQEDETTPVCEFGETENPVATVAVVGDSHAEMFTEPIIAVAAERSWKVVTYLHSGCPYNAERRISNGLVEGCFDANERTRADLAELRPDLVVTTSYEHLRFERRGGEEEAGAAGFAEVWNELTAAGSQVVVIRDTPKPSDRLVTCVTENYDDPEGCAKPADKAFDGRDVVPAALDQAPGVRSVEFGDSFCDDTTCPAVIGNTLVYRDGHHVTATYMRTLVDDLREALPKAL